MEKQFWINLNNLSVERAINRRRTGCYTILSLAAIQNDDPTNGALVTSRIVKPTINRVVSIAHATGRPLSRAARRVEHILKTLLNEELAKGWWRTASPR